MEVRTFRRLWRKEFWIYTAELTVASLATLGAVIAGMYYILTNKDKIKKALGVFKRNK